MQTTLNHSLAKVHSGRQRWMVREGDFDQSRDREGAVAAPLRLISGSARELSPTIRFVFRCVALTSTTEDMNPAMVFHVRRIGIAVATAPSRSRLCSNARPGSERAFASHARLYQGSAGLLPAVHAQQGASNGAARYYHGDLNGSTNALTDMGGAMLTGGTTTNGGPFYYTSFGERVYYDTSSSTWKLGGEFPIGSPRYLYDGGHGYETGLLALAGVNSSLAPITFQHVGERWYQPEIGRFVQRDPIGLGGGLNTYVYGLDNPAHTVDPAGTDIIIVGGGEWGHEDVWIEDPSRNGYWWECGYSNRGLNWYGNGPGWAWVNAHTSPPPYGTRIPTASCNDARALAKAYQWEAYPPDYQVGCNCCWSFVNVIEAVANPPPPCPPYYPVNCFVAGTAVWTPNGPQSIEMIRPGDLVTCWDEDAQQLSIGIVVQTHEGFETKAIRITTPTGSLAVTLEHPFFRNGEWTAAGELCPGDALLSRDGACIHVCEVKRYRSREPIRTYNLTIEPNCNFFVGRDGVLVHNSITKH